MTNTTTDIRQRIISLLKAMSSGAYEREEVIGLALLTALAGESIFLLGLPGVGKSMVARRLKMAFRNARSFEYLMSRFSTPDEIFGPVSITKLKDEDTYERVIDGYLPTADVVFLDEIWKAGPAIQNSLLTALNERIFRNGNHDVLLPLKTIISASNELPAEGEGLEALWDRFLVRYIVEPISDHDAFMKLLTQKTEECVVADELRFSDDELGQLQSRAETIEVPAVVCGIICDIHDKLRDEASSEDKLPTDAEVPYVSDRRWRKIVGIMRMSALLNGRDQVDVSDCWLMIHLLWNTDEQVENVMDIVAKCIANRMMDIMPDRFTPDDLLSESQLTVPVGELFSPDGRHYVFSAGDEDILIDKTDYNHLTTHPVYGSITSDNHLLLSTDSGQVMVRKASGGAITINSFTYKLKRTSPLRTGNTTMLLKRINQSAEKAFAAFCYIIDENIFLLPAASYQAIKPAFDEQKVKRHRKNL